ncbi:MAG: hypothetical protein H6714_01790 [Myxococcales bacterium]|nr:hypothetical protein [Myxococcales bacterium]
MYKRDVYANLLQDTRGLRREQALAREMWFAELELDGKEQCLFELEALLKGVVCFGNSHNHPGHSAASLNPVSHDFIFELRILRDSLDRSVDLTRMLLGERDKAFSFFRYLETVIPGDATRTQLLREQLHQNTPEEALFLLRHAFSGYIEMIDGLLKTGRISHRTFHAVHLTVAREIGRNLYFNPLVALEFRAEFDRIRHVQVLDALERMESESAHRILALTMLTLFRALRYIALMESYASDLRSVTRSYIPSAVLRSDLRALGSYLKHGSSEVVSRGFERELLQLPAIEVGQFYEDLTRIGHDLKDLCQALKSVASSLDLEVQRIYHRELGAPSSGEGPGKMAARVMHVASQLRTAVHEGLLTVCMHVMPAEEVPDFGSDLKMRKASSERLRRDVWMLKQVVKAFIAKASAEVASENPWQQKSNVRAVKEFLVHFRAIGYQLVRLNDYQRLDPFIRSLDALTIGDLEESAALRQIVQECREFEKYLQQLFGQVNQRAELKGSSFNKREAVDTLKQYMAHMP